MYYMLRGGFHTTDTDHVTLLLVCFVPIMHLLVWPYNFTWECVYQKIV